MFVTEVRYFIKVFSVATHVVMLRLWVVFSGNSGFVCKPVICFVFLIRRPYAFVFG